MSAALMVWTGTLSSLLQLNQRHHHAGHVREQAAVEVPVVVVLVPISRRSRQTDPQTPF